MSALVHQLQIERGSSNLYLGSKGQKFQPELAAARKETDTAAEALSAAASTGTMQALPQRARESLESALKGLPELSRNRQGVDGLTVVAADSFKFYTGLIALQIASMGELGKSCQQGDMARSALAYTTFLEGKERAGQERATLSNVFARGEFAPGQYALFISLLSQQDVFFGFYRRLTTSQQLEAMIRFESSETALKIAPYRQKAMEHPTGAIPEANAEAWFEAITAKINSLKAIEDSLSLDLQQMARRIQSHNQSVLIWGGGLGMGLVVLMILMAWRQSVQLSQWLRQVVEQINSQSNEVNSAAEQISEASQSLAEGASEQASSLEETSASLEEMSSMTMRNAESAEKANNLTRLAREAADAGSTDMQRMNTAVAAIKQSSDDIAQIIRTIDEIAFQTNILALNAAVEAARAGAAGLGFAVVAEEVRTLAQRSAKAAKETEAKIQAALVNTAQGVQITSKVLLGLDDIVAKVRQVDELVQEITMASKEQSQGIVQVNVAVSEMDKVTQSNAAAAEQTASAATELNGQAGALREAVTGLLHLVEGHAIPTETQHQPLRRAQKQRAKPRQMETISR
jgi:methyl-accepting chemotaxis protein